jgi:hypothetical protein
MNNDVFPTTDLQKLKQHLHELQNLKLLNPDDLQILSTKRLLQQRITKLEGRDL